MQAPQKQKALILKEFKQPPVYQETTVPALNAGQVLIKMIASTINPSDRIMMQGGYWRTQPNFVAGLEGVGEVIKAGSQDGDKLIGKRVSFTSSNGTWAEYTVASVQGVWVVDNDVPIESAASGVVNPVTVIGFVDTYRKWQNKTAVGKGLINTAAASALGRMLNKYCLKENIPLLNIVRRKEHVQILEKEGAKHIINTGDQNWLQQYKHAIKAHGFNVLFDAIGGGQIPDKLISNLPPLGQAFIYGKLSSQPLTISKSLIFLGGVAVTGWLMGEWLPGVSVEERAKIQEELSGLLRNQLATKSIRRVKLEEVPGMLEEVEKRATQGKFTIVIDQGKVGMK